MQINRSRFLLLTASLAAAACNQPSAASSPDTGSVDPARSEDTTANSSGDPAVWLETEPGAEDRSPQDACDNTVGTPTPCSLRPPAGHCESYDATVTSEGLCAGLPAVLHPRAAEATFACVASVSGTEEVCEWEMWVDCIAAGSQASCVEASTARARESINLKCGASLDTVACQQALSAVRPQHRSGIASCVHEFCEVSSCLYVHLVG
jgi:hypothetical protein